MFTRGSGFYRTAEFGKNDRIGLYLQKLILRELGTNPNVRLALNGTVKQA
jgi:hypothetical protein